MRYFTSDWTERSLVLATCWAAFACSTNSFIKLNPLIVTPSRALSEASISRPLTPAFRSTPLAHSATHSRQSTQSPATVSLCLKLASWRRRSSAPRFPAHAIIWNSVVISTPSSRDSTALEFILLRSWSWCPGLSGRMQQISRKCSEYSNKKPSFR